MILMLVSFVYAADFTGCFDPFGKEVRTIEAHSSTFVAMANRRPGGEVAIVINPDLIKKFSLPMQKVAFWHECGHLALAHLDRGPITVTEEQDADCYGIRVALTLGQVKFTDVPKIQAEFASLGSADRAHLSGPARAINLMRCLHEGLDERVWMQCKSKYYEYLGLIGKATTKLGELTVVCEKAGSKSEACAKARSYGKPIAEGVLKCVSELDRDCPYIADPKFSRIIHDYQSARQRLAAN